MSTGLRLLLFAISAVVGILALLAAWSSSAESRCTEYWRREVAAIVRTSRLLGRPLAEVRATLEEEIERGEMPCEPNSGGGLDCAYFTYCGLGSNGMNGLVLGVDGSRNVNSIQVLEAGSQSPGPK